MSNVAVADINVTEIMSHEENQNAVEQLKAAIESNSTVNKLMEAAQTVEEMYAAVKDYVSLKLDDFKILFDKAVDYIKGPKVKLEDEMMECVVGGFSFSSLWNKYKKTICAVAVVAGLAIVGVATGAVVGVTAGFLAGAATLAVGGTIGGTVGGVIGALVGGGLEYHIESNQK